MCCRATHVAIMVFLIVRIEGIEGKAKPLIGLLTLLGLRATHASYVLPRKAAGSLLDLIRDREQENERGSGEREALSEPWWP